MPEELQETFLFEYPEPLSKTLKLEITLFGLNDSTIWTPIPYEVKSTVLIPETASFRVLCNFTLYSSWTLT